MMKAKMQDLYSLEEYLANFIVENSAVVMGKISVILHYNYRILRDSVSEYLSERDAIITKYGKPTENGGYIIEGEDTESMNKALAELEEINKIEIDVPVITFSMEDLYKLADVVPSGDIGRLMIMTTEYQEAIDKSEKNEDPS